MKTKKDYLIIDRSKWRTGTTGEGYTQLLNKEGYMCCLGFRCHQMSIPKKDLLHNGMPHDLSKKWDIPDLIDRYGYHTDFTNKAISINDNMYTTPKEKEKLITKHFATIGVIVKFTGRY